MHLGHTRYRGDHRDGGLATAGDHVDVEFGEVLFQIHYRYAVRADGRRGQVDQADAGFSTTQQGIVLHMGGGASGIEDKIDVGEFRQVDQPFDAFMGGRHTHALSTGQAIGGRVDTHHGPHFQVLLRITLIIRSVPMLPGPMIATFSFLLIRLSSIR